MSIGRFSKVVVSHSSDTNWQGKLGPLIPQKIKSYFARSTRPQVVRQDLEVLENPWTKLLQWFSDPTVDEILMAGTKPLSIARGAQLESVSSPFSEEPGFVAWLLKFARDQGVRLDPLLGSAGGAICYPHHFGHLQPLHLRWHCVLPPLSLSGPLLTVRRHRFGVLKLTDFQCDSSVRALFPLLLKKAHGILIAGPTGSGKTTFLAAFLQEFCHLERTVILESIPELPTPGPHGISLCERIASLEGIGAVTLERLVAESLRLRPDRLVFGEIRGREARAFWEALSSGHQATMATIHAASADEALSRLAFLAASHGAPMVQGASQTGAMGVIVLERGNPPRVVSVHFPGRETQGEKL